MPFSTIKPRAPQAMTEQQILVVQTVISLSSQREAAKALKLRHKQVSKTCESARHKLRVMTRDYRTNWLVLFDRTFGPSEPAGVQDAAR